MAKRPVFICKLSKPHYAEVFVEFQYYSGFASSQRQKSVQSLHSAYLEKYNNSKVLEVSRFSESILGQKLSAFNLRYKIEDGKYLPVENVFQASKVFANGGPYRDLFDTSPAIAKKDSRLKSSGELLWFDFEGICYPKEPKTLFYDWIYINALREDVKTTNDLLLYDAFTDIVFNPEKSFNCQARAIAIYVSLCKSGEIDMAMRSCENFKKIVYGEDNDDEQLSMF